MLYLPENCRGLFKRPFGRLFSDFSDLIPILRGKKFCTVGDVVTKNALAAGCVPDISVTDGVTKREQHVVFDAAYQNTLYARSPAGCISDELVSVLEKACDSCPVTVCVAGEEDLAVLPLIRLLPSGWIVLYGQPDEGAVLCVVDAALKDLAEDLLAKFVRQNVSIK